MGVRAAGRRGLAGRGNMRIRSTGHPVGEGIGAQLGLEGQAALEGVAHEILLVEVAGAGRAQLLRTEIVVGQLLEAALLIGHAGADRIRAFRVALVLIDLHQRLGLAATRRS